jgi:hypothetical protein
MQEAGVREAAGVISSVVNRDLLVTALDEERRATRPGDAPSFRLMLLEAVERASR